MRASELAAKLIELATEHGDGEVVIAGIYGSNTTNIERVELESSDYKPLAITIVTDLTTS